MKRKVYIIVGYPHDEEEIELFDIYKNLYWTFFNDKSGGAYESDEIIILKQPTIELLQTVIQNSEESFCIIIMIGHGATLENNQLFQINHSEIIKAGQIDFNAKKQIIILESCRDKITNIKAVDLSDKPPKFREGGPFYSPLTREKTKELYFDQINNCDEGIVICLGCGVNESAYNFYFSSFLLQIGKNWHLNKNNNLQVLKINEIMFMTTIEVSNKTKNIQNPEMIGIREFPFVISKF